VCVVGSAALAEACRRAGIPGPRVADVDLAWLLSVDDGEALLRRHGAFRPTTAHNRARGTLAIEAAGMRLEITTLRGEPPPDATIEQRIDLDLSLRDMTVGALAWRLSTDRIHDPMHGLADWRARRVVACGDPAARVREHPIRLMRYYRRAHEWGFDLDPRVRKLRGGDFGLATLPAEALAAELRAALLRCASPGRLLHELAEAGALAAVAPELAPQFDGRPAGPLRYHPEVSQALHLILALEWAVERTAPLPAEDRLAVAVAVLTHDLGKNLTPPREWPSHRGHEEAGLPLVDRLLDRFPGLADARTRRLARAVCALHLHARNLDALRSRTIARLYREWWQWNAFPVALFAAAVGADAGGRLGLAAEGDRVRAAVETDVHAIRRACASVDAGALWTRHAGDKEAFARAHHVACARAVAAWRRERAAEK